MAARRTLCGLTVLLITCGASTTPAQEIKDHPLISRFAGSTLDQRASSVKTFDEATLPVGPYQSRKFTKTERLEGKVTRLVYKYPTDRSSLEVFRSYQQALAKAGFQTLFSCTAADCGTRANDPVPELGYWCVGIEIQCPEPMRVIVAKLPRRKEGDIYAAIKVLGGDTYMTIVEVKPMEAGLVTVNAEAMKKDITAVGHTPVYGVYFDTGKAVVKPESDTTLAEIAKLLQANAAMGLHVVGHTDNVGSVASNMELSKLRAAAVVDALVTKYKISAARIDSAGVGPLAPVATNKTEEGRAKNRRVELVER